MEESRRGEGARVNWKQILVTALITGIITVGAGMLINHFQTREPRLVYSAEDTLPFEGPLENLAIYHVKTENSGKKIVEDVVCQLSFSTGIIQQNRVVLEPSITANEIVSDSVYRLELPNLNPGESAAISILVSSKDQLPDRPEISLRGKGVTGVEASEKIGNGLNWVVVVLSTIAMFAATYFLIRTTRLTRRLGLTFLEDFDESRHNDDQRQVLSYLCGIHKLSSEVERYLNMSSEASYWAESDRFAMLVIEDPMGEDSEKRKRVLESLLKYAGIRSMSEGIIHYNIARIAKAQGKEEEANNRLEEARRIIPELVKTRVELDPIWGEK
jgi:hypothetical protein